MKTKNNYRVYGSQWKWVVLFGVFILVMSCQKERIEIIDEREDQNLVAQSDLNTMMHNISLHDGSYDDHIDGANCFSIQFPYRILSNNSAVVLKDKEALHAITAMDDISLVFPVTIAHSNHSTTLIATQEELQTAAQKCIANDDPDIECIDFEYPITIATFNTATSQIRTLVINHDAALYELTMQLFEDTALRIQYPLTLRLHDNTVRTANSNLELEMYIKAFETSCDEAD